MDNFEIKNRAHSLLEELLSFGVDLNTIERALRGAVVAERQASAAFVAENADKSPADIAEALRNRPLD